MLCVLLIGKPVPAQLTAAVAPEPLTVQPEISRLVALMGTLFARRSSTASGMLPPQSFEARLAKVQFCGDPGVSVSDAIDGVVTL